MKLLAFPVALAFGAITTSALKIPFRRALQRRSGGAAVSVSNPGAALANINVLAASDESNAFDVNSVHDLIYLANITLGGIEYPVQLDTGSSDLWIKGPSTPLPNSNQTSTTQNLTYGIGWAYGHISYAPAEFAGISVPSQAFLDVSNALNPALSYGADGILGLGFTSLSTIDAIVNRTNSSTGRSLLYNLFMDNPSEPNFIAFSLERNSDSPDNADGLFSVGEYDPKYLGVVNTDPISTFPQNSPTRWTILVDSLVIGQNQISVKTGVVSAPANKAVALLDSGTSYTYAPAEVCNAIYGGVQGAHYNTVLGQWVVPCDAEIDMAIQINNQVYPIHPLDVTPQSISDSSTCVGSFVPQAVAVGQGEFDWLIGDNVLRSVYSIYDFGDFDSSGHMGNPYMKLLSIVDPNTASADFHKLRGGTPLTNITYNAANSTTGSTSVSLSDDVAQVLAKIGMFFPAMLAVMAFNALILLVLVIVGVVILCKRRGPKISRKTRGRMSPVPLNRFSSATEPTHSYQPVSMALTEDTFVPPMPAFRGDSMGSKNRPKSSFSSISVSSPASPIDSSFTPTSPSFRRGSGDRPQSSYLQSPIRPQSFMPPADRPQSSYTPTSTIPSRNAAPSTVPDISEVQPEDDITQSSPPEMTVFPEESPFVSQSPPSGSSVEPGVGPSSFTPPASPEPPLFVPPSPSFRSNVQAADRPRSYVPPASPEHSIPVPPSPTFRRSMQTGDRPRSYAPPASPEQTMPVPPSPTFRSSVQPGDRPRSYAPPGSPEQPIPPSPTFRSSVQPGDRPRSYAPPGSPEQPIPPSPTFRSNVQPGDRPRSYAPPASPEQALFAPPSPPFRSSIQPGDRPRSFAPPTAASDQTLFVPPSPTFRRSAQAGDRPRSYAPSAGSPEQTLVVPMSPSFRSNVQPGDRPRSYAPPPPSPEDDLFAPPSPAFKGGDRPRSMA